MQPIWTVYFSISQSFKFGVFIVFLHKFQKVCTRKRSNFIVYPLGNLMFWTRILNTEVNGKSEKFDSRMQKLKIDR